MPLLEKVIVKRKKLWICNVGYITRSNRIVIKSHGIKSTWKYVLITKYLIKTTLATEAIKYGFNIL